MLSVPRTRITGPLKPDHNRPRKQEFIRRVDAVLQQHSGVGVDSIQFRAPFDDEHRDPTERWLNFATASRVKQLIFDFSTASRIEPPCNIDLRHLHGTKSLHLQHVKLSYVSLRIPADFKGFQNLKRIYLTETDITDGDLQLLMSSCSVLKLLGIAGCRTLTRLRISHPSNSIKHLRVYNCRLLQAMELNYGLIKLEYTGPAILLSCPGTLLLTNMCVELRDTCPSLEYIFTKLRDNVPRLEMLTLKCTDSKGATLPGKLHRFIYLKHVRLELAFWDNSRSKNDILEFACLLIAAPFLEKLEFHVSSHLKSSFYMQMRLLCEHRRYMADQGDLRCLPSEPHFNLRWVEITGFYGQKGQLELALHILGNSAALEAMEIDPVLSPAVIGVDLRSPEYRVFPASMDGYEVALEVLCGADRCSC